VVVNPPRSGCAPQVLTAIAEMQPRTLIYVSCHPDSLARDLALLVEKGFRVEQIQPVDMFPQTPHVENVARLTFK
jgi:23S rRNA (uracil1939-C5)-methyltransferase